MPIILDSLLVERDESVVPPDRELVSRAIQSMRSWLAPRYLNGSATIDTAGHIVLTEQASRHFLIGELDDRVFIGIESADTRWIDRLPWRWLRLPAKHDLRSVRATLEFDGHEVGGRLFGEPIASFMLSLTLDERTIKSIRQHGQADFRLVENSSAGPEGVRVSRRILNSIPVVVRGGPGRIKRRFTKK